MGDLTWDEFRRVELRAGTITDVQPFPEARRPAWKVWVDFGTEIGTRKSSAQITSYYDRDDLIGRQVTAVINFPPKQVGPFRSECLVTGFVEQDGSVILAVPERQVPNGTRLA